MTTINEAVRAAMTEWKAGGTNNVDRMREYIDTLVTEAIDQWRTDNVDAICDEEQEAIDEGWQPVPDALGQRCRDSFDYQHGGFHNASDRDATIVWLMQRGKTAAPENSGDRFRIWMPEIEGYFWPEGPTRGAWLAAV